MKFLWLSPDGDGMGLALRVLDEGNEVAMMILNHDLANIGDGMVPKVTDWDFEFDTDTVVVADSSSAGILCDMLRSRGFPICCGSYLADRLENDRVYSEDIMRQHGIKVPRSWQFHSWDDARTFAESVDVPTAFKPSGGLSGVLPSDKAETGQDLIEILDFYQRKLPGETEFTIQEWLSGTGISTEGWFNGDEFIKGSFNHTLERKHSQNENLGLSGGCAGNVVWPCHGCSLVELLAKLTPFLRKHHYVGPLDLNCVVNENEVYGLEFTPRFGYDAAPVLLCNLLKDDIGQFLSDLARGQLRSVNFGSDFAAGVRVSIPPWPSENFPAPEGIPVHGVSDGFYPFQLKMEDKEVLTVGGAGIVGVAMGVGELMEATLKRAYKVADKVEVRHKQYRTDLFEEFQRDLETIAEEVGVAI